MISSETIISCDVIVSTGRYCGAVCVAPDIELALALADQRGWKITADGAHFCRDHRHQVAA